MGLECDWHRAADFWQTGHVVRFRAASLLALFLWTGCGSPYGRVANLDSDGESIVFLGDSLTAGVGAPRGQDFPSRIAERVSLPVINAGVPGNTTADALKQLEHDVLAHRPRVVVVLLGGNDYLRKIPIAETRRNLDAIVRICQEQGAMVTVVDIKIGVFKDAFGELYEEIAEARNALYVKNIWKGIFGNPKLMSDSIHPNAEGYRLMAKRLAVELEALLEAAEGAGRS